VVGVAVLLAAPRRRVGRAALLIERRVGEQVDVEAAAEAEDIVAEADVEDVEELVKTIVVELAVAVVEVVGVLEGVGDREVELPPLDGEVPRGGGARAEQPEEQDR
jgi:hypothetical protein